MSLILPDSLIFDVGANWGQSAHNFVKAGAGHVVSIEPCVENFLVLYRRTKVTPIMAACWNNPGIIEVRFAINSPGWTSVDPDHWKAAYPDAEWGPPQLVPAVTLDMLREKFGEPHAIKIDVEGTEIHVLHGLTKRCPVLWFEFHGKFMDEAITCLRYCQALGFTKAHYVRVDCDLETVPSLLIDEFIPRFLGDLPEWGNITVV